MKKIFRSITAIATALALAGCGATTGSVNAVQAAQNLQNDKLNAMSAQLLTLSKSLQAAQLAQFQAGVDASSVSAATKTKIDGIIAAQLASPTTASVTDLVTSQIAAKIAALDPATKADVAAIVATAITTNKDLSDQMAALKTGLAASATIQLAAGNALYAQIQDVVATVAALPNTATVNDLIAVQVAKAMATADPASKASVQAVLDAVNNYNLSNSAQLATFVAQVNSALATGAANAANTAANTAAQTVTQAKVDDLFATVAAMPTTAQITAMVSDKVTTAMAAADPASKASVNAVLATLAIHATSLANMQIQLDAATAGNAALNATVNGIVASVAANPTVAQVQGLIIVAIAGKADQSIVDTLAATVLGQGSALTAAQVQIATQATAISGLQAMQTATSAQVAAQQIVIDADNATIAILMSQVATLQSQVAPLNGMIAQVNNSFNLGSWGNAPLVGAETIYASNVFGQLKNAPATVYVTGGATVNGSVGPVTVTLDASGQAVVDLQIADGTIGSFWFTVSDLSGNPVVSPAAPIGHVMSPLSTGFAPADSITWDIPPVQNGPIVNQELTAHMPANSTGTVTFSVDNGGTVSPTTAPVSLTGEASTLLTGPSNVAYTVTATLNAVDAHGLALSRVVRKRAAAAINGIHALAGGTTLTGSITISTAAVAWSQTIVPGGGFSGSQTMNVIANASGVYTSYTDTGATNQSRIQKRDANGTLLWTIPVGSGTEQIQQNTLDTDGTLIFVGTNSNAYAFDANGTQVWQSATSYPTVLRANGGKIYIGNNNAPSGHLVTMDAATGNPISDIATGIYPNDMSIAGDLYLVGTVAPGAADIGAARISSTTGAIIWAKTVATDGYGYAVSATAEGVYVSGRTNGSNRNVFAKLALSDGSLIWDKSASASIATTPLIYQIFANAAGVFANTNLGVKKYGYDGGLIWTAIPSTAPGLYVFGQSVYWTGINKTGRINDVY